MNSYLVTVELKNEYGEYRPLIDKITSFDENWYNCTPNTWIIKSNLSASNILTILWPLMYSNDKILVIQLLRVANWEGLTVAEENWLVKNL